MINLGCMGQIYDIKSSIFLEKLESVTSGLDCGRLFIARHMQIDKERLIYFEKDVTYNA